VINRGVTIGIGTVLLVVGLAGLGLLQTGVIYPPSSGESAKTLSNVPPAVSPGPQPGVKPLEPPGPARQSQGMADQSAGAAGSSAPAPQSGSASAQGGQQSQTGGPSAEKPVPIPQVGQGERRYPQSAAPPSEFAQTRPLVRPHNPAGVYEAHKSKIDKNRLRARHKTKSKHQAVYAGKPPATRSSRPVVIRFKFDPARYPRLDVAQVHLGDKIRMKVRSVGQVDRRVYFTFSRNLDSPQGAILELETMYSFERAVFQPRGRGHYEIEVKIYPGNRWNIMPRSFV
jgi:hypothetical protein